MAKGKYILFNLPEYYLILLAVLFGYASPFSFNPFYVVLIIVLVVQIISQNEMTGILLGSIFLLVNLYMLGALISEFNEFAVLNNRAQQLLLVGLSLWAVHMIVAGVLIYKYSKLGMQPNANLEY